jgi:hypothetical protein
MEHLCELSRFPTVASEHLIFDRYNAPEVACQTTKVIASEDLPKCDIWAYGLLVWEILIDGAHYFDKSWTNDPSHLCRLGCVEGACVDTSYENFDKSQLRELAIKSTKNSYQDASMSEFCISFAMSALRALFRKTLQVEPAVRPSDLMAFPIMKTWK